MENPRLRIIKHNTLSSLAEEYGVSVYVFERWIRPMLGNFSYDYRFRVKTQGDLNKIEEYLGSPGNAEGYILDPSIHNTVPKIAERYGLDHRTIRKYIKKMNSPVLSDSYVRRTFYPKEVRQIEDHIGPPE